MFQDKYSVMVVSTDTLWVHLKQGYETLEGSIGYANPQNVYTSVVGTGFVVNKGDHVVIARPVEYHDKQANRDDDYNACLNRIKRDCEKTIAECDVIKTLGEDTIKRIEKILSSQA